MQYLNVIKRGFKNLPAIGKAALAFTSKNSPAILSGFAVAGTLASVIFAVKATPKACRAIEAERMSREEDVRKNLEGNEYAMEKFAEGKVYIPEVTNWEIVKISWKYYIPTALSTAGAIVCIVGAQKINGNRLSALATALSISETARQELEGKVTDKLSAGKLERFKDEIASDSLRDIPYDDAVIYNTGYGDTLFKDYWSGRLFKCSIDKLKEARNDLNYRMMGGEYYISLNEWYETIGLSPIGSGEEVGWSMELTGPIEISYRHCEWGADGKIPCAVLEYTVMPRHDYR